jgi:hypothetical protein
MSHISMHESDDSGRPVTWGSQVTDEEYNAAPVDGSEEVAGMSEWTTDELTKVGDATELQLASTRRDGTLRPYTTMWVVRAGDDLYVRSAYGADNGWYVRTKASGSGRIRAGGVERDVTFAEASDDIHSDIDSAYWSKYERYGDKIVGTVTGPEAKAVTIKLVPR